MPRPSNPVRRRLLQLAGLALAPAAAHASDDIVVAQVGPFTVLPSPDAHEINAAAKAVFARVNAAGGIAGRKLTLVEYDDKFNADEFERQFRVAAERKPVALLSPIGSAAMQRLLTGKLLDDHPIVVINAIPGAESFRKPGHPLLFHVRASDRAQLERIVATARTMSIERLQVLYQALPIGAAGMAIVREIAARPDSGFTAGGAEAKHEPPAIAAAARTLLAANPQGVVLIGTPKFMADALDEVRKAGGRQFAFALSYLPPGLAYKVAGPESARGLGIAQAFPNPAGNAMPLQRELRSTLQAHDPKLTAPTSFHVEGYVSATVLVEALRRAGPAAAPAALARTLAQMGELSVGGFRVDFSRSREGSGFVDIGVVSASGRLIY